MFNNYSAAWLVISHKRLGLMLSNIRSIILNNHEIYNKVPPFFSSFPRRSAKVSFVPAASKFTLCVAVHVLGTRIIDKYGKGFGMSYEKFGFFDNCRREESSLLLRSLFYTTLAVPFPI